MGGSIAELPVPGFDILLFLKTFMEKGILPILARSLHMLRGRFTGSV
jgi:hypothetical protein